MGTGVLTGLALTRLILQRLGFGLVLFSGIALTLYTLACFAGLAPWLHLPLAFGDTVYNTAGIVIQASVTLLALSLSAFLPSSARLMELETAHRSFHIGMRDVARAYAVAHASDRDGTFSLSGEFDGIRERIAFLRDHPELTDLEPSVLEVAAQMSHVSAELAQTYSTRNVSRAKDFLTARQQEVEQFTARLEEAKQINREIGTWKQAVEIEEAVVESQLNRLMTELKDVMPELWHSDHGAADNDHTPRLTLPENVALFGKIAAE